MHPFYGQNSRFFSTKSQPAGAEKNWWIGLVSMVMYLLFWAAAMVMAVRIAKKYVPMPEESGEGRDPAMSIIRERYARGEIDTKEFRQKKAKLS
ncbi:SHOCT domain-containing protein [Anaerobium acetethylicum]|uniref:Putative membrane protein n=1 Tax=Anaerobium acetethylicum TaxID=1619234 RepID=A0A1D3TTV2_9FIRM|nr:SHOCT domain-containing protein [Anaerobium acetethylicum]SCP97436.1 putative membrane protein [Anaerobium acetethylicum]